MHIEVHEGDEKALRIEFDRHEIPVFRAALERAMFSDTPLHLQHAVMDLVQDLLAEVPEAEPPRSRGS